MGVEFGIYEGQGPRILDLGTKAQGLTGEGLELFQIHKWIIVAGEIHLDGHVIGSAIQHVRYW